MPSRSPDGKTSTMVFGVPSDISNSLLRNWQLARIPFIGASNRVLDTLECVAFKVGVADYTYCAELLEFWMSHQPAQEFAEIAFSLDLLYMEWPAINHVHVCG